MRLNRTGFSDQEYENSLLQLQATIKRMEIALNRAGPWLVGTQFTIADICMAPLFQRMEDLGMCNMWEEGPLVAEWFAAVKERPSYDVAFYPGARMTDLFPNLREQA